MDRSYKGAFAGSLFCDYMKTAKKQTKPVANKAATGLPCQQHRLTANLTGGVVRNEEMEGRAYTVVPMVMMVEGVLNGSNGPLLYPANEMAKTPQVWNHKPVVVYHPEIGASACSPEIISKQKVGVIMNTTFEAPNKLRAEAWLEDDRVALVDVRVQAAIANQMMMELSTGVFVDTDPTPGEFKGTAYDGVTSNFRPDHLAILPDQMGACSIADGAGFIRNQLNATHPVNSPEAAKLVKGFRLQLNELVDNELSHDALEAQLRRALKARIILAGDMNPDCWV